MNIVTESPFWLIILCILAGIAYSGVLYYRNKQLNEMSLWLIRVLATFRFILITILSFFLLSPLLRTMDRELERPLIIVAQDNSESIILGKDSVFYRDGYSKNLQNMMNELSDKYDVALYSFGDKIKKTNSPDSIRFTDKQTDISALFEEIETRYSNRNVGAVILASDGLYNKGANPIYTSEKIKAPVYTIAMGDTTIKKDIVLLKVEHNRLAYLGNKFPVQVVVNAKQLKGKTSSLTITKGDAIVFTQSINFNSNSFIATIPLLLEAKEVGLQHYKVKLSNLKEEVTAFNNSRDMFIDILDARQKVLILGNAPHPDIAAIKESLEANQNYEVESYNLDDFDRSIKKYNLLILHQIPNSGKPAIKLINEIKADNIPVWLISGANSIFNNNLSLVYNAQKTNESEPVLEQNFPLFTLSDELRKGVKDFPAIVAPFGTYQADNNDNVLFYQRIGMVETKTPVMSFTSNRDNKAAIFYGEGIWKWRMQDFAMHNNHNLFDEFISKTVQYLSVKVDKSFFKIITPSSFQENESIVIEAEVYNESYELINEPEVSVTITNSDNKKYPFSFSKTNNAYRLDAGMLPVGDYKVDAQVNVGSKTYKQHCEFTIIPLQVEHINTVADHQLLYSIAQMRGGELVAPSEIDKLVEKLNSREDIKSVSYTQNNLSELINLKWVFFLLLVLLSVEWFIRKRNGAY
jgi:hypothetical protein